MGVCLWCDKPLTGLQRKWCCESCRNSSSRYRRGGCKDCGTDIDSTITRCTQCAEKHNEANRRYRKRLAAKGKCTRCGSSSHNYCGYRDELGFRPMGW